MPLVQDSKAQSTPEELKKAIHAGLETGSFEAFVKLNYTVNTVKSAVLQAFLEEKPVAARSLLDLCREDNLYDEVQEIEYTQNQQRPVRGSLLHLAVLRANSELVEVALDFGIPINEEDNNGLSPHHWLSFIESTVAIDKIEKCIQTLVRVGADLMEATTDGFTLIDLLLKDFNEHVMKALINLQTTTTENPYRIIDSIWESSPCILPPEEKKPIAHEDNLNVLFLELAQKSAPDNAVLLEPYIHQVQGEPAIQFHPSILLQLAVKKGYIKTARELMRLLPQWINQPLDNDNVEEKLQGGETALHCLLRSLKTFPVPPRTSQNRQNRYNNLLLLFSDLIEAGADVSLSIPIGEVLGNLMDYIEKELSPSLYLLKIDFFLSVLNYYFSPETRQIHEDGMREIHRGMNEVFQLFGLSLPLVISLTPPIRLVQTRMKYSLPGEQLLQGLKEAEKIYFDDFIPIIVWLQLFNPTNKKKNVDTFSMDIALKIASFLPWRINPELNERFLKYVARTQRRTLGGLATRFTHSIHKKVGEDKAFDPVLVFGNTKGTKAPAGSYTASYLTSVGVFSLSSGGAGSAGASSTAGSGSAMTASSGMVSDESEIPYRGQPAAKRREVH